MEINKKKGPLYKGGLISLPKNHDEYRYVEYLIRLPRH